MATAPVSGASAAVAACSFSGKGKVSWAMGRVGRRAPRERRRRVDGRSPELRARRGYRASGRRANRRSSGWSRVGGPAAYSPGRTPWTAATSSPAAPGHQGQLTGGEACGPHLEDPLVARLVPDRRVLVEHAGPGVEVLAVLEPAQGERRPRRRSRPPHHPGRTARAMRPMIASSSSPPSSPKPPWQRHRTASNSASTARSRTSSCSNVAGSASGRAAARASAMNSGERSTPCTSMPRRASASECRPGPATDVEHPHPRLEPELVDEEPDLVLRPHGERVPEISRPEERRDLVEPCAARVAERSRVPHRAAGYVATTGAFRHVPRCPSRPARLWHLATMDFVAVRREDPHVRQPRRTCDGRDGLLLTHLEIRSAQRRRIFHQGASPFPPTRCPAGWWSGLTAQPESMVPGSTGRDKTGHRCRQSSTSTSRRPASRSNAISK